MRPLRQTLFGDRTRTARGAARLQRCACESGCLMLVEQVVPRAEAVDLDGLLARLRAPEARLPPFDSEAVEVCSRVSTALFRDLEARKHPELQALAFWMRKAELERMRTE